MIDKKKRTFKRKEYPVAKDSKLKDFADPVQLKVLKKAIKNGSAIMVFGSENSPRRELLNSIRLELKNPTSNGIMVYDANVPYKSQQDRDVIQVSVNDWGNANIIHSIKRLGAERSRTLYAYNPVDEEATEHGTTSSN